MLTEIGVEADERRLVGSAPACAEVVERQDRRVAGVAAPEREPPAGELGRRVERLAAARDDHRAEVGVDVTHPEHLRVAADPLPPRRRTPCSCSSAMSTSPREQRVDEPLVVRVEDVVGRHAGVARSSRGSPPRS